MRFSERIGKRESKNNVQLDSMDADLRNSLWNIIEIYINEPLKRSSGSGIAGTNFYDLFRGIWFSFFKEPLDQIPYDKYTVIAIVKQKFFEWSYLDIYDLIDFLLNKDLPFDKVGFIDSINSILKRELSGYRIINGFLTPITNDIEISTITSAINQTENSKYKGANIHLSEALNKISDRKNPDYRNSIKESILSIESICQVITNDPKAELGKTLKKLKMNIPIHPALEQGFIKLYGFTSDSDGIRHALLTESNLYQEDALFMLVSYSAFINYLIIRFKPVNLQPIPMAYIQHPLDWL